MSKGFGNLEERQAKLEQKKALFVRLSEVIPWETFRPLLNPIHAKPRKSEAGRKSYDGVFMPSSAI
jgi:hypothetical protein